MLRGIYRGPPPVDGSSPRLAFASDARDQIWAMGEKSYRAMGYEPEFDTLPIRDDGPWVRVVQRIGTPIPIGDLRDQESIEEYLRENAPRT